MDYLTQAAMDLNYLGRTWRIGGPVDFGVVMPDPLAALRNAVEAVSLTAMCTALTRAAYTRSTPDPLIDDTWGDRLVPGVALRQLRDYAARNLAAGDPRNAALDPRTALDRMLLEGTAAANIILRTRYAEDALRDAVARGIRQYVIVGAGFDSFAMRRPAFAEGLSVFEVDRAPTQALKRQAIAEAGLNLPDALHLVAADLAHEELDAVLARSGYRRDLPAFFSWLGVTMFLTRDANLATLGAIARAGAKGSELVVSYFDRRIFDSPTAGFLTMQKSVSELGEPFRSGFDGRELADELGRMGMVPVEDLDETQLASRFLRAGHEPMATLAYSRIAHARTLG